MRLAILLLGFSWAANSQVSMGGQLNIDADFQAFDNGGFSCTPVQPLKQGDVVAAMVAEDHAWSVDTAGGRQHRQDQAGYQQKGRTRSADLSPMLERYPVVGVVKTPNGQLRILHPAVLKTKKEIVPGNVLHIDGYQIDAKQAIKIGEPISVLVVGDVILGIDSPTHSRVGDNPWFVAVKDGVKASDRADAVAAWRIETKAFGK